MNISKLKSLIKECILEVLIEAFDPLSQGPNIIDPTNKESNPYRCWNEKMRKLEEDGNEDVSENEHGREAQIAGAGQFDPRTFKKL